MSEDVLVAMGELSGFHDALPLQCDKQRQQTPHATAQLSLISYSGRTIINRSAIGTELMEYICKYCGKVKGNAAGWLLGFEGVAGGRTMKGAISLLGKWDQKRADEPTAIHFCSIACQTRYLVENFGDNSWAA